MTLVSSAAPRLVPTAAASVLRPAGLAGAPLEVLRVLTGSLLVALCLHFASSAQAQSRVGDPSPAVDTVLLDGRVLPAKALRGKVVLHMFWATWCPVCVAELPDIRALYSVHAARGFEVIALSLDRDQGEVEKFWRARGYGFPVAMRTMEHRQAFGDLYGTPTFVLSDRSGVVRVRHPGAFAPGELEGLIGNLL